MRCPTMPQTGEAITPEMPTVQLYRLDTDPEERHNLYADRPDIVEELRTLRDGREPLTEENRLSFTYAVALKG